MRKDSRESSQDERNELPQKRWPLGRSSLIVGSILSVVALCSTPSTASPLHDYYLSQGFTCQQCHPCGAAATDHAASWMDQTALGFHAYAANLGLTSCQGCHGANLDGVGGTTTVSCGQCHGGTWRTNCVMCHGGVETAGGAPPKTTWGYASDPVRTGAHTAHLSATHNLGPKVACSACHVTPTDVLTPGHIDAPTASLTFSGLAIANVGVPPTWDNVQATCSNTYCHGATIAGGTNKTPTWTVLDGSQRSCTSCHGAPPPSPHVQDTNCGNCHSGYSATSINPATHLNGTIEATGSHPSGWAGKTQHGYTANLTGIGGCKNCHGADLLGGTAGVSCASCHTSAGIANWDTNCTFCHGNRATGRRSPPVDIQGRNVAGNVSVGRHDTHVGTALMAPPACAECHPTRTASVITDAAHIDGNGVAEVAFGPLAKTGGVNPTYARASATSATCAATYCHGNFSGGANATLSWTSTATATCTLCHGNPPGTGHHGTHQSSGVGCGTCHGTGYARTGTSTGTVVAATHVNGVKNLTTTIGWNASTRSCSNSCHGTQRW